MKTNNVKYSAYDVPEGVVDSFRIPRLMEAFAGLPDHLKEKIERMHDHKGMLTIQCRSYAPQDMVLIQAAWRAHNEWQIEFRNGNGAFVGQTEYLGADT